MTYRSPHRTRYVPDVEWWCQEHGLWHPRLDWLLCRAAHYRDLAAHEDEPGLRKLHLLAAEDYDWEYAYALSQQHVPAPQRLPTGIYRRGNRYRAMIFIAGRTICCGQYASVEQAQKAREAQLARHLQAGGAA